MTDISPTQVIYRWHPGKGWWIVQGPASMVRVGEVEVTCDDGSTGTAIVTRVAPGGSHDGVQMAIGILDPTTSPAAPAMADGSGADRAAKKRLTPRERGGVACDECGRFIPGPNVIPAYCHNC